MGCQVACNWLPLSKARDVAIFLKMQNLGLKILSLWVSLTQILLLSFVMLLSGTELDLTGFMKLHKIVHKFEVVCVGGNRKFF